MSYNFNNYLFGDNEFDQQDPKLNYKKRFKEINLLLSINGFQELGDIFDPSLFSIGQTLKTINSVVDDRQKLLESKSHLVLKINSLENENLLSSDKINILNQRITELTKTSNNMKIKSETKDKKQQEDFEKLKIERDELSKVVKHLGMKETQFKHEVKRLEKLNEEITIKHKKLLQDKTLHCNCKQGGNKQSGNKNEEGISPTRSPSLSSNNLMQVGSNNTGGIGIIFTNPLKNSNSDIMTLNRSKEFYNLIYYAFSEKIKQVIQENSDYKESLQILQREITQYIDFKKVLLTKFCKRSYDEMGKIIKSFNFTSPILLNEKIYELDLNDSKENISNNFNQIMNSFRNLLIYDVLQVEEGKEFDYEEAKNSLVNNKHEFKNITYYDEIKKAIEKSDINKFKDFEILEKKLNKIDFNEKMLSPKRTKLDKTNKPQPKIENQNTSINVNAEKNVDLESKIDVNKSETALNDYLDTNIENSKILESLNALNSEFTEAMNQFALLEVNISNIESDIYKINQ